MNVDEEWDRFLNGETRTPCTETHACNHDVNISELYISTKTIIVELNRDIDINEMFWSIPVLDYHDMRNGVLKKQIKILSSNQTDYNALMTRVSDIPRCKQQIFHHYTEPKFRDVRKINIGICKHDISGKKTDSGAFYNCFVVTVRVQHEGMFYEVHIKVFNTGKLEIPGIKIEAVYQLSVELFKKLYASHFLQIVDTVASTTVLINSNFSCGYYIDRHLTYKLLKKDYKLHVNYDPCSYPGIQCKFYYYRNRTHQDGRRDSLYPIDIEVSFMIFRTGSVLIVGKCTQNVLYEIYHFIRSLFIDLHSIICTSCHDCTKLSNRIRAPGKLRTFTVRKP